MLNLITFNFKSIEINNQENSHTLVVTKFWMLAKTVGLILFGISLH